MALSTQLFSPFPGNIWKDILQDISFGPNAQSSEPVALAQPLPMVETHINNFESLVC